MMFSDHDPDIYEEMQLDKMRRITNKTKRAEPASPTQPPEEQDDFQKSVNALKSALVPPEDLRHQILDWKTRGGQVDELLRLCEAAVLAALPEKIEYPKPPESARSGVLTEEVLDHYIETQQFDYPGAATHNKAIATAQANIHSVFGGTNGK